MSTIAPVHQPDAGAVDAPATGRTAVPGLLRGRPEDPVWVRPALFGPLAATGLLYLWGLGASGWANAYYSAAAQAATKSWKALFFGSSDAATFITVDKARARRGRWGCRPGCSG